MVQGAGRPGQPNIGQRSIFGNGGPNFTQMPTYTPVTRGPAQPQVEPQAPYPPQTVQPAPAQPSAQPAPQPPQPMPAQPQPAAYQQQPQPQPQDFGAGQPSQPQAFETGQPSAPQGYNAPGAQEIPDLSDADPGFPESIFGDFKAPDASFPEPDFSAQSPAADQGLANAGFPEPSDAVFPEASFPEPAPDTAGHGMLGGQDAAFAGANIPHYDPASQAAPQAPMPQQPAYQPQAFHPQQHAAPQEQQPVMPQQPQAAPGDPGRQLQAYDSVYDQPPQIALGGGQGPAPAPQEFFEADRGDADFMDESQVVQPASKSSKLMNSLKGRSVVMVASALLGAIALGGALAYAYKQSGGSGEAPMITADATPVKEAPDQPGGKEFPHKNKLIYDRLTNGDQQGGERLVPRQEDVAVPALPPGASTAGLPAPVATTDLTNPATTQSVGDGGPRKVNTFVVRPDGSVEAPAAGAAAGAAADAANTAAQAAQDAAGAAAEAANGAAAQAAGQPSNVMPVPAPQAPVQQQVAAASPAAAAAPAAEAKYVVQLGSSKSQTEALANFADAQQKYPGLLGNYQPIVRKTNLGAKGTWYRLQVGPMADKSAAYKLCGQLKAKGRSDCLVMAQ